MKTNGLGLAVCMSLVSVACSKTSSAELETNEIRAEMSVYVFDNDVPANANGSGSTPDPTHGSFISTSLYKSDNILEVVELADGDSLSVATNLNPSTALNSGSVPGFFSSGNLNLSSLTFANFIFTRTSKASAPNSKVTVPEAIKLTSPSQDSTVSFTNGKLPFIWSNPVAGARLRIFIKECNTAEAQATNQDTSFEDIGSHDVSSADLPSPPKAATCYLARVERYLQGTPDPAWRSGSRLRATRTFYMTFVGTP